MNEQGVMVYLKYLFTGKLNVKTLIMLVPKDMFIQFCYTTLRIHPVPQIYQ